ncbi:16S rRNA (adenine(1518)-N(6)/adenine(1519)-N(6))-dimethyltransferase RsmA [Paenibacillus sp. JTLBN-2024]
MQRMDDIASPRRTKEIIQRHGFSFKKSLGQNFLIDQNILGKIVEAAGLDASKGALEIGPGIGALTEKLAREAGAVTAVEIDQRLIPILQEVLEPYPHVRIHHGDVLKTDLGALFREDFANVSKVSVVANLPYYVTTPILMKLLEERLPLENIVVMIQKEVAERMAASPGTKDYGSLSIAVQYYSEPELVCIVPKTVFIPQPNVESAVIRLKVREQLSGRGGRRKFLFSGGTRFVCPTPKNDRQQSQDEIFPKEGRERLEELLHAAGIEPSRRGETLSLQEYATLCNVLLRAGVRG